MTQAPTTTTPTPPATTTGGGPENGQLVLLSLILVAAVANLNLSVANVALPDIGKAFDASQTALDLVAVGYSLGLAASVLWLGALGDHYGRKLMLILGVLLSIPACLTAAFAPSIEVLIVARVVGGISAGMAYPTTLALLVSSIHPAKAGVSAVQFSRDGKTVAFNYWQGALAPGGGNGHTLDVMDFACGAPVKNEFHSSSHC
jgi:MFS family permease